MEEIEVFYDGLCPVCVREIGWLRRLDRAKNRIRFTDIAAPNFRPEALGQSREALMNRIHGRLPNGDWVEGVEVFRRLYAAVGFGGLVKLSRLAPVSRVLEAGYEVFAKNRLKWTGRCSEDRCGVEGSWV